MNLNFQVKLKREKMSEVVSKRSEVLFLYDIKDMNPNGDPLDENKPRIDEETSENLVSDVRLKRTIRDYLYDFKKQEIFIKGTRDDKGNLKDKEERMKDLKITTADELLKKCIDIRHFGATTAIKGKTITITGPVQFKIGRSLHRVKMVFMKGTTVMPSDKTSKQGTFTEQYILPYSLIGFYGVINENAAKTTQLTNNDVNSLIDGLWNGTKNLISRSKVGQMPRLLIKITYKDTNYHIGDLNALIRKANNEISDEEIRDISQLPLDVSSLIEVLSSNKAKIDHIEYSIDPHVRIFLKGKETILEDALKSVQLSASCLKL
jgi:CRISPR-associated protein Csh2